VSGSNETVGKSLPRVGLAMRLLHRSSRLSARFTRAMLLGVRAIAVDEQHRVFLVRHSYMAGWHFPGGGVEVGETLMASLERELAEEGNLVLDEQPILHGVFFNHRFANRDHVAVFVARRFHQSAPRAPDWEIADSGFFPLRDLPAGATRAVRARLAEVFEGAPLSRLW
jgi:ADP-ribose pyrophosphatase YjhB (NUDIX family)